MTFLIYGHTVGYKGMVTYGIYIYIKKLIYFLALYLACFPFSTPLERNIREGTKQKKKIF
jgi:hypothetical protein